MEGESLRNGNPEVELFREWNFSHSYTWPAIVVKGWDSFHWWEGNRHINGNPKVAYFNIYFSDSDTFPHAYILLAIILKGWVSYHSWEGNPLINENPKVAYFTTHFSESESFHRPTLCQVSSLKNGCHFIHVRGTPLKTGTLKLHILALTFQKINLFTLV